MSLVLVVKSCVPCPGALRASLAQPPIFVRRRYMHSCIPMVGGGEQATLRIMILIARILGELEPSVAADDDADFEVLACFLVHFSPKGHCT